MKINRKCFQVLLGLSLILSAVSYVSAHCEIPCGIYDDEMRVKMLPTHNDYGKIDETDSSIGGPWTCKSQSTHDETKIKH